jgi:hypothetical protein
MRKPIPRTVEYTGALLLPRVSPKSHVERPMGITSDIHLPGMSDCVLSQVRKCATLSPSHAYTSWIVGITCARVHNANEGC